MLGGGMLYAALDLQRVAVLLAPRTGQAEAGRLTHAALACPHVVYEHFYGE